MQWYLILHFSVLVHSIFSIFQKNRGARFVITELIIIRISFTCKSICMSLQTGIIVHIDLRYKEEHKNLGSFRNNHNSKYYSYLAPVTGSQTISNISEAIKTQIFNNCTVMVIHIQGTQNSIILTGFPT